MKSILTPEKRKEASKRSSLWYFAHKFLPEFISNRKERLKCWREKNHAQYLLQCSRANAKERNVLFNLTKEDIKIPEVCPVFGTKFEFSTPFAASIDRINPTEGYVKSNVQVISRKANLMKQNASEEELRKFANWILKTSGP